MRTVHSTVLLRRAVRLWRTNDGGILRRFIGYQPDGSSETAACPVGLKSLAASNTQPATQSSHVGMLDANLLATRGTRSCADGTVRTLGLSAYSRPSSLLATRRCDLVKPAKGGSRFWAVLQQSPRQGKPSDTTNGLHT